MNPALDLSLRQEVMALRKKVVLLETAESDNERLRKEMTRLRISTQEEQSKFELEFMNQLSEVVRENAMKMDAITDELRESREQNRALNEHLKSRSPAPAVPTSALTNGWDPRSSEVRSLKRQLKEARESRDDLFVKLEASSISQTQSAVKMKRIEEENRSLKNTVASLQKEKNEMKVALGDFKSRQPTAGSGESDKDATISALKKEIQTLRSSALRIENESRDLTNSSRNENSSEQIREPGRSPSRSRTYSQQGGQAGIRENRTSRIIKQLEQNLKNDGQKKILSYEKSIGNKYSNEKLETERIKFLELEYKSQISKLQAELSSTKDLLAREKDVSGKHEKDSSSKLKALHETLSNAETSRAALALDKERLIAQTNQITEEKLELEQKSKRQHQQLKKLQKLVEEHLNNVERNHKDDEIEIRHQKDQVESLKRELLESQQQVSQLKKAIEKTEEKENAAENLAKLNVQSQQTVQSLQNQLHNLQKELTVRNTRLSEVEIRHKKEIHKLETALDSAHMDLRECIDVRDKEIEKFKSLAQDKSNEARALEKGKEQLVLSMQDMVKNRRDEVDDFQNEMVQMSTRLANETRKVSTLRSRLEQSDYPSKEMGRLRKRITELSRQLEVQKETDIATDQENRELRKRLKEAFLQQSAAEDKLQQYLSTASSSKPVQVLRERNASLKDEVERLTRKVEKLSGKYYSTDSSMRNERKAYASPDGVTRMAI